MCLNLDALIAFTFCLPTIASSCRFPFVSILPRDVVCVQMMFTLELLFSVFNFAVRWLGVRNCLLFLPYLWEAVSCQERQALFFHALEVDPLIMLLILHVKCFLLIWLGELVKMELQTWLSEFNWVCSSLFLYILLDFSTLKIY